MQHSKPKKLLFFQKCIWRRAFLLKNHIFHKFHEKSIMTRSSVIPTLYEGLNVKIYNGKKWTKRYITKWIIGFKFGELTWNRKIAIYKKKQLKKKKK